ncbi:MAG: V-type ATPase subunit [Ruminococcus sp.]|nr:V-type ATPase subunit [Ruminococcus sp.]
MGNLLAYSGIVTKLRAMEAKLLTSENFQEIASYHSVSEVVQYLRDNSSYSEILNNLKDEQLHRGSIEKVLTQGLYRDYSKIYSFCNMQQRRFMKLYIKRYEIDLIKYCFRIVLNEHSDPLELSYKKAFFDKYSSLSIDSMIASQTADELIESLKGTEYHNSLINLTQIPSITLFDYDLALDQYYFSILWKDRKKLLKKKELEIYTRDFGSQIDLLNLQWIYRARKYYRMTSAEIYTLIIPIQYKLSTDLIKELVESPDAEAFKNVLQKTVYAKYAAFVNSSELHTAEDIYMKCMYHLLTRDRRKNPYSIASVNTYLFLKEEEVKKLTTAIECIRYGLTPDETLSYVGGNNR